MHDAVQVALINLDPANETLPYMQLQSLKAMCVLVYVASCVSVQVALLNLAPANDFPRNMTPPNPQ